MSDEGRASTSRSSSLGQGSPISSDDVGEKETHEQIQVETTDSMDNVDDNSGDGSNGDDNSSGYKDSNLDVPFTFDNRSDSPRFVTVSSDSTSLQGQSSRSQSCSRNSKSRSDVGKNGGEGDEDVEN
jgi:hypothetical protein